MKKVFIMFLSAIILAFTFSAFADEVKVDKIELVQDELSSNIGLLIDKSNAYVKSLVDANRTAKASRIDYGEVDACIQEAVTETDIILFGSADNFAKVQNKNFERMQRAL